MGQREDRAAEAAHGGVVARDGDVALLRDGGRWWLNGEPWARAEIDAGLVIAGSSMAMMAVSPISVARMAQTETRAVIR